MKFRPRAAARVHRRRRRRWRRLLPKYGAIRTRTRRERPINVPSKSERGVLAASRQDIAAAFCADLGLGRSTSTRSRACVAAGSRVARTQQWGQRRAAERACRRGEEGAIPSRVDDARCSRGCSRTSTRAAVKHAHVVVCKKESSFIIPSRLRARARFHSLLVVVHEHTGAAQRPVL